MDNAKSTNIWIPQKIESHENLNPTKITNHTVMIGMRQLPYCHDLVFVEKMQWHFTNFAASNNHIDTQCWQLLHLLWRKKGVTMTTHYTQVIHWVWLKIQQRLSLHKKSMKQRLKISKNLYYTYYNICNWVYKNQPCECKLPYDIKFWRNIFGKTVHIKKLQIIFW